MKLNEIANNINESAGDEIETEDGWGKIIKTLYLGPLDIDKSLFKVKLENGETGFYTREGERVKEPHKVMSKGQGRTNET